MISIYHREAHEGQVVTDYSGEDMRTVVERFVDGDIGITVNRYSLRTKKGRYVLEVETEQDPPAFNPERKRTYSLKTKDKETAIKRMIARIVKPWINKGDYSFPGDSKELQTELEHYLFDRPF